MILRATEAKADGAVLIEQGLNRIAEFETELRRWLEIYARSESGATIAVPTYQIERLLKST